MIQAMLALESPAITRLVKKYLATGVRITLTLLACSVAARAEFAVSDSRPLTSLTLTAEITVHNGTGEEIFGYVHRVAIPVAGHMQQQLIGIRHDRFDRFERRFYRHHVDGNSGEPADQYAEMEWDIPAHSVSKKLLHFDLVVSAFDMEGDSAVVKGQSLRPLDKTVTTSSSDDIQHRFSPFLAPAEFIESDAAGIVRVARDIQEKYPDPEAQLRAAFRFPQRHIKYQRQKTRGALYALNTRRGDCSEYAALFVAIARAMGYPARLTSEFLFVKSRDFAQPNHHAAEVYLNQTWIPVDANLALEPDLGYGFGSGRNAKVVLNRNGAWVWSNLWPRGVSQRQGTVDVGMQWHIEVTEEGNDGGHPAR
ncbi:transglutaminase-like domain-containing protein [Microbulbifer sp. SA54]|uniref:transglutaminase-like domain-containing protein n=1 Tax=Microbulbifer sp. SA54 TaxID=3401577 RepID=UPI003AAF03E8